MIALLIVAVGLPALSPAADESAEVVLQRIERAIGEARCADDAQCRVAPIGASPCGGPEGFRAWSTRDTDAATLEPLLRRHATLRQAEHERSGLRSTCLLLPTPTARCARSGASAGRCVLMPAGPT